MLCQLKVHAQNFPGMSGSSLHLLQLISTGLRCIHMHHKNQYNIPLQMKQKLVQDEEGGKKETDCIQNMAARYSGLTY